MKDQKNSKNEIVMKFQKGIESVKRTILAVVFMTFSVCMTQGQATVFTGDVTIFKDFKKINNQISETQNEKQK